MNGIEGDQNFGDGRGARVDRSTRKMGASSILKTGINLIDLFEKLIKWNPASHLDQITVFWRSRRRGFGNSAGPHAFRHQLCHVANLEASQRFHIRKRAGTAKPKLTDCGPRETGGQPGPGDRAGCVAGQGARTDAKGGSEVSLVVDVMPPKLVKALDEFAKNSPPSPRLQVEALGAVTQAVLEKLYFGLGIARLANDLLVRGPTGSVRLIPVAAADHPLAQMGGPISPAIARDHPVGTQRIGLG